MDYFQFTRPVGLGDFGQVAVSGLSAHFQSQMAQLRQFIFNIYVQGFLGRLQYLDARYKISGGWRRDYLLSPGPKQVSTHSGSALAYGSHLFAQIDLRSISNANFSFPSVMLVMFYFHSGDSHILASFPAPSEGLIDPYIRAQVAFLHVPVSGLCNRIYWGLHYLSRTLSRLFLLLGRTGLFQQCRALSRRGSSGRRPIRPWQFFQSPE